MGFLLFPPPSSHTTSSFAPSVSATHHTFGLIVFSLFSPSSVCSLRSLRTTLPAEAALSLLFSPGVSSLSEYLVLWSSLSICCIPVCSLCSKTAHSISPELSLVHLPSIQTDHDLRLGRPGNRRIHYERPPRQTHRKHCHLRHCLRNPPLPRRSRARKQPRPTSLQIRTYRRPRPILPAPLLRCGRPERS